MAQVMRGCGEKALHITHRARQQRAEKPLRLNSFAPALEQGVEDVSVPVDFG
jgi:hypothetical protein